MDLITDYVLVLSLQLDIIASFEIDDDTIEATDSGYDCPTSGGAANRGVLGPFGIVVFADKALLELTPIYFYVAKGPNGKAETHFCADELRLIFSCTNLLFIMMHSTYFNLLIFNTKHTLMFLIFTRIFYVFVSEWNVVIRRSSEAADVDKIVYGSKVPVVDGEKFTIRSLVCNLNFFAFISFFHMKFISN